MVIRDRSQFRRTHSCVDDTRLGERGTDLRYSGFRERCNSCVGLHQQRAPGPLERDRISGGTAGKCNSAPLRWENAYHPSTVSPSVASRPQIRHCWRTSASVARNPRRLAARNVAGRPIIPRIRRAAESGEKNPAAHCRTIVEVAAIHPGKLVSSAQQTSGNYLPNVNSLADTQSICDNETTGCGF